MKSVQGVVVRIGIPPPGRSGGIELRLDSHLLEPTHKGTSGATLIWGYDVDPVIHADRYSIAVVCVGSVG